MDECKLADDDARGVGCASTISDAGVLYSLLVLPEKVRIVGENDAIFATSKDDVLRVVRLE